MFFLLCDFELLFKKCFNLAKAAKKRLVFIVGGAFGFSKEIYSIIFEKLSLSKMTFNHQMIKLFFCEQLYRANTILNHEKYHNE